MKNKQKTTHIDELLIQAAGLYGLRLKNLKKICKENDMPLPRETNKIRQECIDSIYNKIKTGKLKIKKTNKGYQVLK